MVKPHEIDTVHFVKSHYLFGKEEGRMTFTKKYKTLTERIIDFFAYDDKNFYYNINLNVDYTSEEGLSEFFFDYSLIRTTLNALKYKDDPNEETYQFLKTLQELRYIVELLKNYLNEAKYTNYYALKKQYYFMKAQAEKSIQELYSHSYESTKLYLNYDMGVTSSTMDIQDTLYMLELLDEIDKNKKK